MKQILFYTVLVLGVFLITSQPGTAQSQRFADVEAALGSTANHWAFMTAWDLSSGELQVSPSWFNGEYIWNFNQPHYQHWVCKFIYDQATGATRELQWSFRQVHIQ